MHSNTTFFDNKDFLWTDKLKENFAAIKKELLQLLDDKHQPLTNARDWFFSYPDYTRSAETKTPWQTLNFISWSIKNRNNCNLCPKTIEALQCVPDLISAEFSLLQPNTKILPHKGYSKMVLRSHLALIIPDEEKCAIKIENDTRHWKEGEILIFNDALEHEAWNDSDKIRIVLMFDFLKPGLEYSKEQVCEYKIKNMTDPFLLNLASKEKWLQCLKDGYF